MRKPYLNIGRLIVAGLAGLGLVGLPSTALATPSLNSQGTVSAEVFTAPATNLTATIRGKVLTAKGKPAKGGFVQVWQDFRDVQYSSSPEELGSGGLFVTSAALTKKGTYTVSGLKPGTKYHIVAGAAGHLTTWLPRRAGNFMASSKGVTKTAAVGSVTTAKTIKLLAGGVTVSGKIAGFKKGDTTRITAYPLVPISKRPPGVSKATWKKSSYVFNDGARPDDGLIGYLAHVFVDGSYIIPGVAAQVMQIQAENDFGQSLAITQMPAKGRAKVTLKALPRNQLVDSAAAEATVSGYFAPGYSVRVTTKRTEPSPSGDTPNATVFWTDGLSILGHGRTLAITTAMVGQKVWPVLRWHVNGRHLMLEDLRDKVGPVTTIPLQGALTQSDPQVEWGETVTAGASPAGWTNTYQWYCGAKPITGATSQQYTPAAEDVACSGLSARVSATGPNGQIGTADSPAGVKVLAKAGLDLLGGSALVIQGKAKVGRTLSIVTGIASEWTVTYSWLRDGKAIPGAKSKTYRLTKADRGHAISLRVKASRVGYETNSGNSANAILLGPVKPKVKLTVTSVGGTTAVKSIKAGQTWLARIDVYLSRTGSSFPVGGTITIKYGNQSASAPASESIVFEMPPFADPGSYPIHVTYLGDGTLTKAKAKTLNLKVVR